MADISDDVELVLVLGGAAIVLYMFNKQITNTQNLINAAAGAPGQAISTTTQAIADAANRVGSFVCNTAPWFPGCPPRPATDTTGESSAAASVGQPECYPSDFVGPLPPGAHYCSVLSPSDWWQSIKNAVGAS